MTDWSVHFFLTTDNSKDTYFFFKLGSPRDVIGLTDDSETFTE